MALSANDLLRHLSERRAATDTCRTFQHLGTWDTLDLLFREWAVWLCPVEGTLNPIGRAVPLPPPHPEHRTGFWTSAGPQSSLSPPWWPTAETQFSWPSERWAGRTGWRTSTLASASPSRAEPGGVSKGRHSYLDWSHNVTGANLVSNHFDKTCLRRLHSLSFILSELIITEAASDSIERNSSPKI